VRLLAMLPRHPALAEKWKRRPRQRPEGGGVAAQSLLTAVQTQPACQTAATLPPEALQPLLVVVLPPSDPSSKPPAAPNPAQRFGEGQVRAAQHVLSAVQIRPPPQIAWMLPPADLQPGQAAAPPPHGVLLPTSLAAAYVAPAVTLAGGWLQP